MTESPALARTIFDPDHELFRDQVRAFVEKELVPHHAAWEERGVVPREVWRAAGARGLLCTTVPEEFGGPGGTFLHAVIVMEELARRQLTGPAFPLHSEIVAPYLLNFGGDALKRRWLPRMCSGEAIGAIAMTEPGAGSDLAAIATRATREGDDYVISGSKTFISNGQLADLVIVAASTAPERKAKGISLFVVEGDRAGFRRGRALDKIGYRAQDTSELFFDAVRVPADNLLGEINGGFAYLMHELPQERLEIAVSCLASAEACFDETLAYVRTRRAFRQAVLDFQNTRFKLAQIKVELQVGRVYLDRLIDLHAQGLLDAATAAGAKLWTSELFGRVADECLQLHGGYGYMREYAVGRAFVDARLQRLYGGTSEIMREIVARTL